MITAEQLREHTGRKPFAPFWLKLTSGETIYVTERFRAVATPREMVVTTDGRTLRHLRLEQIVEHGLLSHDAQSGNGGAR